MGTQYKFSSIHILLIIVLLCLNCELSIADTAKINFQCEQINDNESKAFLMINFESKRIELDSYARRKKWKEFNEFMSRKNLPNSKYLLEEFIITEVKEDEVLGIRSFPIRGSISINRNTLMIYTTETAEEIFIEETYLCKKIQKGF
jgi:hypothetical protein